MPAPIDIYAGNSPGSLDTPDDGIAITPHDTNELSHFVKTLLATAAGTCRVVTKAGTTLDIYLPQGVPVRVVRIRQVKATGTAATGITGYP